MTTTAELADRDQWAFRMYGVDLSKYAHLRAPRGKVLVRLFPAEATFSSSSVIVKPETYRSKRPRRGIVVAIGDLVWTDCIERLQAGEQGPFRVFRERLVHVGDEVLIAQWTLSTAGPTGVPQNAMFWLDGQGSEQLLIADELKDVYAVIERDGENDRAQVE